MPGGIVPSPWVLSSVDALSTNFISKTLLCSRQNSVGWTGVKQKLTVCCIRLSVGKVTKFLFNRLHQMETFFCKVEIFNFA